MRVAAVNPTRDCGLRSTGQRICPRIGSAPRATHTGTWACRTIFSATEPITQRRTVIGPPPPVTISCAPTSCATRITSSSGTSRSITAGRISVPISRRGAMWASTSTLSSAVRVASAASLSRGFQASAWTGTIGAAIRAASSPAAFRMSSVCASSGRATTMGRLVLMSRT
ncbi:MAG: hypothetical protein R3B82_11770 [Sandaracinaceae bacterium]